VPERQNGRRRRDGEQDDRLMGNSLYEQDFHAWTLQQAELLRERKFECADIDNIAEEIESMGKREKRELVSRLAVLLMYLLKWQFQPGLRSNSWRLTIKAQRRILNRHLKDNPSLKSHLDQAMFDAYGDAIIEAQRETGLAEPTFPETCPFTFDQTINDGFSPGD
jgi:Domain of unknown function DUF29